MRKASCYIDGHLCTGASFNFCGNCLAAQRENEADILKARTPLEATLAHVREDMSWVARYPGLFKMAYEVRAWLESTYGCGGDAMRGHCVEASELLSARLRGNGYDAHPIEGYCWYEHNLESCTDEPCDAHTWVQVYGLKHAKTVIYIDVTADQFNHYLSSPMPRIYIGGIPYCMKNTKPTRQWLVNIDWE